MSSTRRIRPVAMLSMLALLAACASAPHGDRESDSFAQRTSRVFITAKELQSAGVGTTYDAVRRIRPDLLTRRAVVALDDPYRGFAVVYLDGKFQGSIDLLNTIPVEAIAAIQYLSGREGHSRYGRYHPGGVIEVDTRR